MSVKDCGVVSDEVEQYREVDINSLENRAVQEIGAEWVVKQIMDRLEVRELLWSVGMDQHEADHSYIAGLPVHIP